MNNTFKKLNKIKNLSADAKNIGEFHERYKNKISQPKVDKHGKGFNSDDRFTAFKKTIYFGAKAGDYGSSSTYSQLHLCNSENVGNALVKWLNQNEELVFQGMAEILRKEAGELLSEAREEVAEVNEFLDGLEC